MSAYSFQTVSLALIELAAFSVFLDRWANRSPNTISQYLYEDAIYRRLLTLYTFLHIAVLYLSIPRSYPQHALLVAAVGWFWLVIFTNHGSRPLHIFGAVVYIVGVFAFACMHSFDYEPPSLRLLIQILTALSIVLACVFGYYESHRSHVTYILEHSLFVMCQLMYAFFVHFAASIYEPKSPPETCPALTSSSTTSASLFSAS
jgi:hypothetical protein